MAEHKPTITDTHHALAKADHAAKVDAVNAMAEMLKSYYRAGKHQLTMAELETAIERFAREDAHGHPVKPLKHTPAGGKLFDAREFLEEKGFITLLYHRDFADSEPGHAPDGEGMQHGQEQHIEDKTFKRHMPTIPQSIALHPILDSFDPQKPFTLETVTPSTTAEQIASHEAVLNETPLTHIHYSEKVPQGTLRFTQQQHPRLTITNPMPPARPR